MRTSFTLLFKRLAVLMAAVISISSFKHSSGHFANNFSYAVSPGGDINGDGYGDVILSIFKLEFGVSKEGKVFLYYGTGNGLSANPVWSGSLSQADANFGEVVANAGDINGDGFGDVIIGASHYSNGEDNEGAAFVYYGSPSGLSKEPSWIMESNQANAFYGGSVASAGDVNKDGFADVIIGAHFFDNGETNEGKVFVYLGSASGLSKTPFWVAEGNQVGANFGKAVASAGDVNKDGYFDVIVGAPNFDNGQNNEGRAFIFLGSPVGMTQSAAWTGESNQVEANFGNAVASAGDINGDGFADVIIGANRYDEGKSNVGKIYVYLGAANGVSMYPDWTYSGAIMDGNLGLSVAPAGDINGDGYGEFIVGSYLFNIDQPKGIAYVYTGSKKGVSDKVVEIDMNNPDVTVGQMVSSAGDINGDGYADIIAGVIWSSGGGSGAQGKAMLVQGSSAGLKLNGTKDMAMNQ
ncbi:integrin alpha [Pollutibacter soli]|uniref:integrin alpha n=1 Tax=Pollutibacter soli TaxID=3034157 RepID=UPI003013F87C